MSLIDACTLFHDCHHHLASSVLAPTIVIAPHCNVVAFFACFVSSEVDSSSKLTFLCTMMLLIGVWGTVALADNVSRIKANCCVMSELAAGIVDIYLPAIIEYIAVAPICTALNWARDLYRKSRLLRWYCQCIWQPCLLICHGQFFHRFSPSHLAQGSLK